MTNDNLQVGEMEKDWELALAGIAMRLVQMAKDRGISVFEAAKVYNAYGADGASRLAEHEALTERVRVLENIKMCAQEFYVAYMNADKEEDVTDAANVLKQALEQPPLDPMKEG